MAFFPTYKDRFTRTPNVFFDVILKDPKVTINQVRLVGYLIRATIGYNREAKWAAVSRSILIKEAGIPNSRIKEAIAGCEEKEWVLTFEQGKNGKQERYIFLNDPLNQCIVRGLKQGCFTVADLEYLNLAGINKLLEKHGLLHTPTETGEEQKFPPTETGGVTSPETGGVTSPETGGVDKARQQVAQRVRKPLNTSSKDNKEIQQQYVIVVIDLFQKELQTSINEKQAKDLIELSAKHNKSVEDAIKETRAYYDTGKPRTNPYGAVWHAITTGWNIAGMNEEAAPPKPATPAHVEVDDSFFEQLVRGGAR